MFYQLFLSPLFFSTSGLRTSDFLTPFPETYTRLLVFSELPARKFKYHIYLM